MARAKPDLPPAAAIRALVDGEGRLAIRVTPGAREETIALTNGQVQIKVRAKPEDGKATAAVLALLAQALGVGVTRLSLVRGATSRDKLIRIQPEG
jgi:uncharacterized protein YggU (UPF0235/DUF167 family)